MSAAFAAGFIIARPTRWVAATLSALFGADVMQLAYSKAENELAG